MLRLPLPLNFGVKDRSLLRLDLAGATHEQAEGNLSQKHAVIRAPTMGCSEGSVPTPRAVGLHALEG